jgi:hypothetical protein
MIAVQVNSPERQRHPDAFNPYIDNPQMLPSERPVEVTVAEAAGILRQLMPETPNP